MRTLSAYVHIPFCKQACHYCNFHFSASTKLLDPMVQAISKEIELQQHFFKAPNTSIDTIYFGGGTPSLLPTHAAEQILATIKKHFSLSGQIEITLEANPDDITEEQTRRVEYLLNNRPRKSLGFKTPLQVESRNKVVALGT